MATGKRAPGQRATSRDPEEWARATEAARVVRERVADEVAGQVRDLIISGDIMGGPELAVMRVRQIAAARARGEQEAIRSAVMDAAAAFGAWVAGMDYRPPSEFSNGAGE